MIGMFPNVQNSKLQVDADSETSVRTHTAKIAHEKKNAATVAIHITANDEQHTEVQRQKSRMTRLNAESDSIFSRTVVFKKGRIGTCTWESSRQDPKIRENQTLQHSGNHPSNSPCAWEKWQGNQLGHCTRTANGTTHTTEEATLNFCDLNMFVEVQ